MGSTKKWNLQLWQNINGKSPTEDFLEYLRSRDKVLFSQVLKRIDFLQQKRIVDLMYSKDFEILKSYNELYEFKIHSKQEVRMLGVLDIEKSTFHALHAFIKKDQKIRQKEIDTTIIRLGEFKK